jgi:hypothetical protein
VVTSVTTAAGASVSLPLAVGAADVTVAATTNPATTANTRPIDAKDTTGERHPWTQERLLGRPEEHRGGDDFTFGGDRRPDLPPVTSFRLFGTHHPLSARIGYLSLISFEADYPYARGLHLSLSKARRDPRLS